MRNLKFINLAVILGACLFTLNALAASPVKVHVLENLSAQESKAVHASLVKLGYAPSKKALFSESKDAIIITKALKNETDEASLTVELVHLDHEKSLPRTVFEYRLSTADVGSMMNAFPRPESLKPMNLTPVALQTME